MLVIYYFMFGYLCWRTEKSSKNKNNWRRQKDRKTERQKDRKTERQKDRTTERQKDRNVRERKINIYNIR